jgi:NTP pyrophosphatase (non-canonical NTP hydrolase)
MQFVQRSKNDVWQTPRDLIDFLEEHVEITLDPCAGRETNHGRVNFRLPETDGLATPWDIAEDVTGFVNPAFSQKIRWLRRAIGQYMIGNVDRVIFLTPDSTDVAEWWHALVVPYFPVTWFEVSRMDFVAPPGYPDLFDGYEDVTPGEKVKGVSFNTSLHFLGDFPDSLFEALAERGDLVHRSDDPAETAPLFDARDRRTFERALDHWGIDAQVDKAEEEAFEFGAASKHYAQGRADVDELVDELADLQIMLAQLSQFLGRERVEQRVDEKMGRLRRRLEGVDDGE